MSDEEPKVVKMAKSICVGTTAGIAVTIVGHPFDTLKVRLQTQNSASPVYSGLVDCVRKTLKWEGVPGLYKGVWSPVMGQIFFRTALFTSYYESLSYLNSGCQQEPSPIWKYFLAGTASGVCASTPDSLIELIIAEKKNLHLSVKYSGVFDCFVKTLKMHGFRGICQGLGPTFARDIPGYTAFFGSNEYFKRMMAKPGQKTTEIGMLKTMLCAGMTGLVFWTLIYNVDVVKSAMMADDIDPTKRKYKNMWHCAKTLCQNEGGYKRLWVGYAPCIQRAFLANALMLYVVDITRKLFPEYKSKKTI